MGAAISTGDFYFGAFLGLSRATSRDAVDAPVASSLPENEN
jgi:hypothetical protein